MCVLYMCVEWSVRLCTCILKCNVLTITAHTHVASTHSLTHVHTPSLQEDKCRLLPQPKPAPAEGGEEEEEREEPILNKIADKWMTILQS